MRTIFIFSWIVDKFLPLLYNNWIELGILFFQPLKMELHLNIILLS